MIRYHCARRDGTVRSTVGHVLCHRRPRPIGAIRHHCLYSRGRRNWYSSRSILSASMLSAGLGWCLRPPRPVAVPTTSPPNRKRPAPLTPYRIWRTSRLSTRRDHPVPVRQAQRRRVLPPSVVLQRATGPEAWPPVRHALKWARVGSGATPWPERPSPYRPRLRGPTGSTRPPDSAGTRWPRPRVRRRRPPSRPTSD